jgi:N-acetylmuramoyl-L-alanine amidase
MRLAHFARLAALFATLPFLLGVTRPEGLGDVKAVRTWSYEDYTRVVVELSREVKPVVERLQADPTAERPERVYLDLDGIWVGRRYESGIAVDDGLLSDIRVGQNTLRRCRVVLDLERYDRHRVLVLEAPHRVVVDVYGASRPIARSEQPFEGDEGRDSRLAMDLRPIRKVVIDPGHGGTDPGAIGIKGLREKDVNLKLARKLGTRLEALAFEVAYTHTGQGTLDLEERTAVAESEGGDLFISVHANAARRKGARGLEIYYLDANDENHDLDVAARENGISLEEVDSLQRTLARLRVGEASRHSKELASIVHAEVKGGLAERYRGMPDLGVKTGPFYVLFLSSMPSILIEAGFVTNREDSALLRNDDYLNLLADRIALGLSRYRESGVELAARRKR